ncbi:MAG: glycosyltransferase family 4 protein [Anaerolineae bacterium]|nr:glycosyltransferase family 4 protein [Anaerolineae bacterium]
MKISLLHYAAPPVVGGVETVLAKQAEQLAKAGHQVTILTGRGERWEDNIQVKVIPQFDSRFPKILKIKEKLDTGKIPSQYESAVLELLEIIRSELADEDRFIVHNIGSLHKNLPLTDALYRYACSGSANRMILWHHDFAWNSHRYKEELHPGMPWDLLRMAWPGATQVVVSEARRDEMVALTGISPSLVQVIPAGVDVEKFLSLNHDTFEWIEQLGLLSAEPLLLSPVRVTKRKNLELAIHILAKLRQQMPEAQLVVTGPLGAHNPANQRYLQNLLELRNELGLGNVVHFLAEHFKDGLTETQMAEFYRLADVLLLPSREEGFGIPVIEAGLGRLIAFCSDIAPLRALGQDWINYFSVDEPPSHIAERMLKRLTADPVYQLRAHVRRTFTWEAIYKNQIAPLLDQVR